MRKVLCFACMLTLLFPLASVFGDTVNNRRLEGVLPRNFASEEVNPEFVEWVADDRRFTSDQFYEIESYWTVPSPPPDGTFGWVGIQLDNHPGHPEYRAVWAAIFWGSSPIGGGPYWSLAVFWRQWVGPGTWDFEFIDYNVIEDATETGHVVWGEITKYFDEWHVHIFDTSQPDVICSDVFTETMFPYQFAAAAILIPSFQSAPAATKLPGTTYFTQLDLLVQDYTPTPSMWVGGINYYGYGLEVRHGTDWAALYTCQGPPPPPPVPVGGITVPIDKVGLLAPYIGLASTIVAATVVAAYVKHAKRRKEKH